MAFIQGDCAKIAQLQLNAVLSISCFLFFFVYIKVKHYSVPGSFLKVEYLETEVKEDNGTYTIIKGTSHSSPIIINLSISGYFDVVWHHLKDISACFFFVDFLAKCQDSLLT